MEDCERLLNCAFITAYESDENLKYALRGFVMQSCQAEEQRICIEKNLRKALGACVPAVILPGRFQISGTTAAVANAVK